MSAKAWSALLKQPPKPKGDIPEPVGQSQPSMTLAELFEYVGQCSSDEIERLKRRYTKYDKTHRLLFADLLSGKTYQATQDDEFLQDAAAKLALASYKGERPSKRGEPKPKTASGDRWTVRRRIIRLAVRVMFLRLTRGGGGQDIEDPLSCDKAAAIERADAERQIADDLSEYGIGYHAIRKHCTPFQT
jgi:hypothetical protein